MGRKQSDIDRIEENNRRIAELKRALQLIVERIPIKAFFVQLRITQFDPEDIRAFYDTCQTVVSDRNYLASMYDTAMKQNLKQSQSKEDSS